MLDVTILFLCIIQITHILLELYINSYFILVGVLTALLTYVLRYCGTDHKEQEKLLKVVCSVLQRIVFKNKQVKTTIK